jgi:hypothetical protein
VNENVWPELEVSAADRFDITRIQRAYEAAGNLLEGGRVD